VQIRAWWVESAYLDKAPAGRMFSGIWTSHGITPATRLPTETCGMYPIELKPGKEAVYGTLADFVEAVRRGEIGWQARIYHRAKSMWVPVTVHPHFRKLAASRAAPPPSPLPRAHWTFLPPEPGQETPAHAATADDGDEPLSDAASPDRPKSRSWRSVLGGLMGAERH
jgi:hypothetical protein